MPRAALLLLLLLSLSLSQSQSHAQSQAQAQAQALRVHHAPHAQAPPSRVLFDVVPRCVPNATAHVLARVAPRRCPCFVSFSLASKAVSPVAVDFLVMRAAAYDRWQRAGFAGEPPPVLDNYSPRGKTADVYTFVYDFYFFQTENMELDVAAEFALVIRTTSPVQDCILNVMYIFEPKPSPCPPRLPPPVAVPDKRERAAPKVELLSSSASNNVVAGTAVSDPAIRAYMVSVRSSAGSCSGTVVAPSWVLTAAHCQVRRGGQALVAGTNNLNGAEHRVDAFVPHPDYVISSNGSLERHDIALVRVTPPIRAAARVLLNTHPTGPSPATYVRASGYGQIAEGWTTASPERDLLQVDMPVVGFEECVRAFVDWGAPDFASRLDARAHMCIGFLRGECGGDTCYGDSGGPVVTRGGGASADQFVQVGVVSGGIGCARRGLPGVYTRVGAYFAWINATTRGEVRAAAVGGVDDTAATDAGDVVQDALDAARGDVRKTGLVISLAAVGAGVVTLTLLLAAWSLRKRRRARGGGRGGAGEGNGGAAVARGSADGLIVAPGERHDAYGGGGEGRDEADDRYADVFHGRSYDAAVVGDE